VRRRLEYPDARTEGTLTSGWPPGAMLLKRSRIAHNPCRSQCESGIQTPPPDPCRSLSRYSSLSSSGEGFENSLRHSVPVRWQQAERESLSMPARLTTGLGLSFVVFRAPQQGAQHWGCCEHVAEKRESQERYDRRE
jgi:hypothetical protein